VTSLRSIPPACATSLILIIPTDEQLIAHVKSSLAENPDQIPADALDLNRHPERLLPLPEIKKQHDAHHISMQSYRASPDFVVGGHRQVPSPQRAKGDGSDLVYTKAPSYADSYEKVPKIRKAAGDIQVKDTSEAIKATDA
jgi:hypothetical protein